MGAEDKRLLWLGGILVATFLFLTDISLFLGAGIVLFITLNYLRNKKEEYDYTQKYQKGSY